MRLASGNVALTRPWPPSRFRFAPRGRRGWTGEIRVGVPARRADGSGRRTAGRWVAPPAVATVRFSGLRVVGRDSLERDSGGPWEFLGALMTPRGPIGREQAGSPARHSDGALGGCPSKSSGHPHRAPASGSAFSRRCMRSVLRRPWRRCRPGGAGWPAGSTTQAEGSPHVPSRSPP